MAAAMGMSSAAQPLRPRPYALVPAGLAGDGHAHGARFVPTHDLSLPRAVHCRMRSPQPGFDQMEDTQGCVHKCMRVSMFMKAYALV